MKGFYGVFKTEDGYCLQNGQGFILPSEETIEIAKGLIEFAYNNKQNIIEHNNYTQEHLYDDYSNIQKIPKLPNYKKPKYLYLIECYNKYKIGITDNIKRRISQLDTRPFKLNLIAQTNKLIKDAYKWEQYLYSEYKDQNIEGEWFNLTENQIKDIIDLFGNLDYCEED